MQHAPASVPPVAASGGVVVERPPAGLARGRYEAAPWAIATLGALAIVLALAYAYFRFRKHRG
jgi:hypothetical protein